MIKCKICGKRIKLDKNNGKRTIPACLGIHSYVYQNCIKFIANGKFEITRAGLDRLKKEKNSCPQLI